MQEWVVKHKWWLAGGAAAFVVLYYLFSSSSSQTASGGGVQYVQTGPSDAVQTAAIAQGTQLALAQAQATVAAQGTQAQLNYGLATLKSSDYQTSVAGNVASQQAQLNAGVATHTSDTNLAATAAGIAGQVQVAGFQADTTRYVTQQNDIVQAQQIQANSSMFSAQLASDTARKASDNAAAVSLAKINGDVQYGLSANNANVALGQINAAAGVQNNQIDTAGRVAYTDIVTAGQVATTQSNNALDAYKTGSADALTANLANTAAATTLYGAAIDSANQQANLNYSLAINSNDAQTAYLNQLIQLKANKKDTSGLPGTGPVQYAPINPYNSAGAILNGIANIAKSVVPAVFG